MFFFSKNCFFSFRQIQPNGNFGKMKKFFWKKSKKKKNERKKKNFLIENCVIHKNVLYISYNFRKLCYLKFEIFIFHLRLKKLRMLYITFFSRVGNNILSHRIVAYIRYPFPIFMFYSLIQLYFKNKSMNSNLILVV